MELVLELSFFFSLLGLVGPEQCQKTEIGTQPIEVGCIADDSWGLACGHGLLESSQSLVGFTELIVDKCGQGMSGTKTNYTESPCHR
jgi:hypothetical protein